MSLLVTLYYLEITILSFPWGELEVWIPYYSSYIEIYHVILHTYLDESLAQPCNTVWIGLVVVIWTFPPIPTSQYLSSVVLESVGF